MRNRPLLRAPFGVLLLAATAIAFAQQPAQAPAKARALPTQLYGVRMALACSGMQRRLAVEVRYGDGVVFAVSEGHSL
jgi:hypothetical protein